MAHRWPARLAGSSTTVTSTVSPIDTVCRGRDTTRCAPVRRGSAVTAAANTAARSVALNRGSAILAPPGCVGGPRPLVEDLDLPGVDELLEPRMLDSVRGNLSG